jgi:hypothetical protein
VEKYTPGMEIEFIDRLDTLIGMIDTLLDGHVCATMAGVQGEIEEAGSALADAYNLASLHFDKGSNEKA